MRFTFMESYKINNMKINKSTRSALEAEKVHLERLVNYLKSTDKVDLLARTNGRLFEVVSFLIK